jgi:release factor glutamine methyltransferase
MKKKTVFKKLLSPFLVPVTKNYLGKERSTNFMGLHLTIPVGIFHPSLFFSTKTMCKWIMEQNIQNKKILEIGCGSGAISITAAKGGANVICCDINPEAVKTTLNNAKFNKVEINSMLSDLFEGIEETRFDMILNNPPYYAKDPANIEEHAWNAGHDLSYFKRLFTDAKKHLAPNGKMMLVLSDECNIDLINQIAQKAEFHQKLVYTRPTFIEKTYILQYEIAR